MRGDSPEGCVLHIAALPFPSQQGTQAAIRAMLEAEARAGRPAELFTYASAGFELDPPFKLHRSGRSTPRARVERRARPREPRSDHSPSRKTRRDAAPGELRSGPSLLKVMRDARMAFELRRLIAASRPRAIVAHHVEAAVLARTQAGVPSVFFAHTDLAAELPSYATRGFGPVLRWAGGRLDRFLVEGAGAVASVSPALGARLGARVEYVPIPWLVPAAIEAEERSAARRAFGFETSERVALYAGNLDAYQDPFGMLDALAALRRDALPITLLLASASAADTFLRRATQLGVNVASCALEGESRRRQVHAAADLAIVPRAVPGGLPIKLLDALARGVPCAVSPHAAEGLVDRATARCAESASSAALARAVADLARDRSLRERLSARGRAYIADQHGDAQFVFGLDRALARAVQRSGRDRDVRCATT